MQLVLLLLLSLSYSEGRLYTFQPLTYYHFPAIPSQSTDTTIFPLQLPTSPRLLLYPSSKQSLFNSPFPPHNLYTYFLTPSGNILTATDDLMRGSGASNKDEAPTLTKTSLVTEQLPAANEDGPVQGEAPFVLEQLPAANEDGPVQGEAPFVLEQLTVANEDGPVQGEASFVLEQLPAANEDGPVQGEAPFALEQLPAANEKVPIHDEAFTTDSGLGAPPQSTKDVLPKASSFATTNLLTPASVSQQDSSRIQTEDGLGGYHFRYSEGSSSRDETRDRKGTVRGSYGVKDPSGKVRTYHYVAGTGGFRISGPGLPSQHSLKTPAPKEIMTEPEKISLPEAIWPDTIQEEVHPFPVLSEPSSLKLESRSSESLFKNDLNAIKSARDNAQLAHPYMSQAAYESVYGIPAVSVPVIVPVLDEVQNDQSSALDSATREPAELEEVVPTTPEADAIETTTTGPFVGTVSSAADPRQTP